MPGLLFGTAGIPLTSRMPTSLAGVERIAELGLGCMEVEFVQGVRINESGARALRQIAAQRGVVLSAHAPYYINLNSRDPKKTTASRQRLLRAARIGALCEATSIVFHAGFYLGDDPSQVYSVVKGHLRELLQLLRSEGNQVKIRPEVTGRESQFGTLEEVLRLSAEVKGLAPCIDFAHWHARTGAFNSHKEFVTMLQRVESALGRQALDNMHLHVAGIEYGRGGEKRHLRLKDSDLNFIELLQALKDYGVKGSLICESPNLEEDALLLQECYEAL